MRERELGEDKYVFIEKKELLQIRQGRQSNYKDGQKIWTGTLQRWISEYSWNLGPFGCLISNHGNANKLL